MTNNKENDPFAWRSGGGSMKLGNDPTDAVSSVVVIGNDLLIVMRRSIHSVMLADSIDPNRTNPQIPNSQRRVVPYGSDDASVGRTLLQANVLFEKNTLPSEVDRALALRISLEFLKEILALRDIMNEYKEKVDTAQASFEGKLADDKSLHLPFIPGLEQITKRYIQTADDATGRVMELAQVFYSDIRGKRWIVSLHDKLRETQGETHNATMFVKSITNGVWLLRNLRNAVEHPKETDHIEVENYTLNSDGTVGEPIISCNNPDTPLSDMSIMDLMEDATEALQEYFEMLMAHFCDIHALPFVGMKRYVSETKTSERQEHLKHVRFEYQIEWKDLPAIA